MTKTTLISLSIFSIGAVAGLDAAGRPPLMCGTQPPNIHQVEMEARRRAFQALAVSRPGPDNTYRLIARLDTNTWPDGDRGAYLDNQINHDPFCGPNCETPLARLADTADFEANARLRLLFLHGSNPILQEYRASIVNSLLNFKYWVDEPRSSNPEGEMTFWSENHQILFATAEYLAGQLFPDQNFPRSGMRGAAHKSKARPRILRWLNDRLRFGFSEWNAPGYYEEDIAALLNLVDFADDPEIQTRAGMVLDLLIFDLARFTVNGSFGVTAGRAYAEHKVTGWNQSVGEVIEILFGTRKGADLGAFLGAFTPNSDSAHALASSTRYCVPNVLLEIGKERPSGWIDRSRVSIGLEEAGNYGIGFDNFDDGMFWWGLDAYFTKQAVVTSRRMVNAWSLRNTDPFSAIAKKTFQGFFSLPDALLKTAADTLSILSEGSALTRANLYTYKNKDVMLSSVQNWRKGQVGFQVQPWQATIDNDVAVWTTYPAADDTHDGPNWWTGSAVIPRVAQRGNAAIIAYNPNAYGYQFFAYGLRTHIWFPWCSNSNQRNPACPAVNLPNEVFHGTGFEKANRGQFDEIRESRDTGLPDPLAPFGGVGKLAPVWYFGRKDTPDGEGYIGIFSARGCDYTTSGSWAGKEIICNGLRNVFIVQVGNRSQFGSFDNFVTQVKRARINVSGNMWNDPPESAAPGALVDLLFSPSKLLSHINLTASYEIPGNGTLELNYDQASANDFFPRFDNPFARVDWGERLYTIRWGGYTLTHDVDQAIRTGDGLTYKTHSGFLTQSTSGRAGNFEMVVPQGGGLFHYWRDNDHLGYPWNKGPQLLPAIPSVTSAPTAIPTEDGLRIVKGATLIQSNLSRPGAPGSLEVVAHIQTPAWPAGGRVQRDYLAQFYFDGADRQWHGPFEILVDGKPIEGVTGTPALIQSTLGRQGNFEMLVPQGTRLVHYFRDNDAAGFPWRKGPELLAANHAFSQPVVLGVTIVQSNLNDPGNLEVIAHMHDTARQFLPDPTRYVPGIATPQPDSDFLYEFYFDSARRQWHGPSTVTADGKRIEGVSGDPAMIQSTWGIKGNFELLVPQGDRLVHYWRDNDAVGFPWHKGPELLASAAASGVPPASGIQSQNNQPPIVERVTLLESTLTNTGDFDAIAHIRRRGVSLLDAPQNNLDSFHFHGLSRQWQKGPQIAVDGRPIENVTGPQ